MNDRLKNSTQIHHLPQTSTLFNPIHLHLHLPLSPSSPTLPSLARITHIPHLHLSPLIQGPLPRIPHLPLHLPRLFPRHRRRFSERLARARGFGVCELGAGEPLDFVPLATEGASGFGLEGGGRVGVGAGGHFFFWVSEGGGVGSWGVG